MAGSGGQDLSTWPLDKIDAREQALTSQIEQSKVAMLSSYEPLPSAFFTCLISGYD
ncbi:MULTISPECIES: hypothetical protein [Nonomuraea]|uniref:Uncharacterized protein n=1 Tax=Nonomuraea mangrovi TaxID=2316207 RepID=A0ABW4T2I5_9ACTN